MNSSLFDCKVAHDRLAPRRHRFEYRIFMLSLDLDELPRLHRQLHFFSVNDQNILSFHERDYLPQPSLSAPAPTLKGRVAQYLQSHDLPAPHRVTLVTLPRMLGYAFNPVSFYFCFDANGHPSAAIAEVTNTFHEMKPYLLTTSHLVPDAETATFLSRVPKFFYVSPFSDVDVQFEFKLPVPGEQLRIHIDDFTAGKCTLLSRLYGERTPLTDVQLITRLLRFPLMTLGVITAIHWHALRLWLKGIPWFSKAARPRDQKDLFRPHSSLKSNEA